MRTLSDARRFVLHQPDHIQERRAWQRAAELLMKAAEDAGATEDATRQVELALFIEARPALR